LTEYLIGTGGWAYFKVPGVHSLVAYSRAFNFVEVNSTFYEIPKTESVKSWRRTVPEEFEFSVRCNKKLTHDLKFEHVPESYEILDKMVRICKILKAEIIHFQTLPSLKFNNDNIKKIRDFFLSTDLDKLRIAFEIRNSNSLESSFGDMLRDLDIIHCVDFLKGQNPAYHNDILYTRLFGKGEHNIYQPLDSELQQIDTTISKEGVKKAVVISHSVRMFKDAARFKIYKKTGEFPMVTKSTGINSLAEVLKEDARFPTDKTDLINHQGWKVIDLTPKERVHASYLLNSLPEKTYYGIDDIIQVFGEPKIG
jgi:uncharacterized protein YecE (DUF72 family)